jgi:hypothetical protein
MRCVCFEREGREESREGKEESGLGESVRKRNGKNGL